MIGPKRFVTSYLATVESVLASQSAVSQAPHRGDRGEDREEFLVLALNNLLPQAARAFRGGTILDLGDRKSDQTDIVIYSVWSPLLRHTKKPVFLAEGTYAAIEVKSRLDRAALRAALLGSTKIKRLRKFHRGEIRDMGLKAENHPTFQICTGIYAYASMLEPEALHDHLIAYHKSGVANQDMIDFVCVNGQYCFHRLRNEHSVSAYSGIGTGIAAKTLEQFQAKCIYLCSPIALGTALATILEFVSNIRPSQHNFGKYLHTTFYTP
jgi:hypothetical protein